jgi:hypothetical protein
MYKDGLMPTKIDMVVWGDYLEAMRKYENAERAVSARTNLCAEATNYVVYQTVLAFSEVDDLVTKAEVVRNEYRGLSRTKRASVSVANKPS